MSGPDLYVLTVVFLALKKTGFSKKKILPKKKKFFFYLFSMQLFSADATMFSKNFHENKKKTPSKVAHNRRPQPFFQVLAQLPKPAQN